MNRFKRPKILTCVHSFCLRCLEKWVKKSNGELSCPTCRDVCQIPEGGLKNLKNNMFISGLLDYVMTLEQKTAPTCSLCSTVARFVCQDCDELYCTSHRSDHTKMKMSQHHCIVTLEEYATLDPLERLASKPVLCSEHNMPFLFYCDSCEIPVCVGCTQIEHSKSDGHNIVEIKTAFESFSTRSQSFIKTADERLGSLQSIANELKKKEALEMSTYKKRQATITEEADKAHRLIDQYKTEQLQELESTYQRNLKLLNAHVSDVELAIAKFSSMQGIAHTLIHSPNHAMALRSSSDVSKRMDEHLKQNVITDDMQKPNVSKYNNSRLEVLVKSATDISKSTLIDDFGITFITRDSKGAAVYIKDLKVKCWRVDHKSTKDNRPDCVSLRITDEHNGRYIIEDSIWLSSCTLICLIINGSDVLFKTFKIDSRGSWSINPSDLILL
ncbi:tripartite motif-containing protein 2-like [Antedon mediterranea]|uniref:tripartite motif-containing protein 2-like n=1 Tax=Antedon mediterranea TaxID=105859 RepID=UPI003AF5D5DD